jgi:hypothetical protein
MSAYYVNKNSQSSGEHEVHKSGCSFMPAPENKVYLGDFLSCQSAVVEARKKYSDVDGCYYCSNECNKK